MATITITASNPQTGELILLPANHVRAKKRETINWRLASGCGVASIVEIEMSPSPPYPPSTNIFSTPPHPNGSASKWKAVISNFAPDYSEYNYYIKWSPEGGGDDQTFDPKISIMPSIVFSFQRIVLLLLAIFGFCALALLFSKKKKKKW